MRFVLAIALAVVSFDCLTQTDMHDANCNESQRSANECSWKRYAIADQRLNGIYHSVLQALPTSSQKALRAEQRQWLKQLEPKCEESAGPRETSGQIWKMEFYDCMAAETSTRTKQVEAWRKKH